MKIIQFRCEQDPPATQLKQVMVDQINTWSRLQRLASDPDYTTAPFGLDVWQTHESDPNVFWIYWDDIYPHLGDDGKKIADRMLGDGPLQGILRLAPLVTSMPNVKLQVVDLADPKASGYVHAREKHSPDLPDAASFGQAKANKATG